MKVHEASLLFFGPLIFVDSLFEVVVVSLSALFSVSSDDVELVFHDGGDETPFFYLSYLANLDEALVFLR